MAEEPARSTISVLLAAEDERADTVLDLDYRPVLWTDSAEARRHHRRRHRARPRSPSATGRSAKSPSAPRDPDEAARRLLARGLEIAVVKLGGDGVLVATADGSAVVPPQPVEVVCGLGAGDAFGGAFVHGLLSGWPPERTVAYANAAGAIVASRLLCADAMPTNDEILTTLGSAERNKLSSESVAGGT